MARPRKHPKAPRRTNRNYKDIQPKPSNWLSTPGVHEKQSSVGQDKRSDGSIGQAAFRSPSVLSSMSIAFENRGVLLSGVVYNGTVENPSGFGPMTGAPGPFGNDNNETPLPNLDFPSGYAPNVLSQTQTEGVGPEGETMTAPNVSLTRPPERGIIYAVGAVVDSGTEPLCAVFNRRTDYSCMLATTAEKLLNVTIRDTTPAQRQRWYPTPAGQICDPQRYAELTLKAFDPYIPAVNLTMLLLENDGPIDGVHVYLGKMVFTKLTELGISLSVREVDEQNTGVGALNWAVEQNGIAEMPALQGFGTAGYSGGPGLSNMSHFDSTSPGLPSTYSYSQGTMSTMTSLVSEASYSTSTASSLGSFVAPVNDLSPLAKSSVDVLSLDSTSSLAYPLRPFKTNPANDVFLGYAGEEAATHDGGFDSDIMNPVDDDFLEYAGREWVTHDGNLVSDTIDPAILSSVR